MHPIIPPQLPPSPRRCAAGQPRRGGAPAPRAVHDSDLSTVDSFIRGCACAPTVLPAALALRPGTLLGEHLRLVREIGAGGMGRVFEAHDLRRSCSVAV